MSKPEIVPDEKYPYLYRIVWEDGSISDILNLTRAKDAVDRYLETKRRKGDAVQD